MKNNLASDMDRHIGLSLLLLALALTIFGCSSDGGEDNNNPVGGVSSSSVGGDGGVLTVTDIPAEYNGKYFYLRSKTACHVGGFNSYNSSTEIYSLTQISNGSVSVPLWKWIDDDLVRYFGNETCDRTGFYITSVSEIGDESELSSSILYGARFNTIIFSNGNATILFNNTEAEE